MATLELIESTGIARIDNILRGVIALGEQRFPGRILAWYLGGSHSDGTGATRIPGTHASDLDLFAVFREELSQDEDHAFVDMIAACNLISPIMLDAHGTSEAELTRTDRFTNVLNSLISTSSLFLFGQDLRERIASMPFDSYVHQMVLHGLFHMGTVRQGGRVRTFPLEIPLRYPLSYPEGDAEFYGYELRHPVPGRPVNPMGTRLIVSIGLWIATFYLIQKGGHRVGRKSETVALYPSVVADHWTPLVLDLFHTCKGAWGYTLPEAPDARQQLQRWCQQLLVYENQYLRDLRPFILSQLKDGHEQTQLYGLMNAMHVIYPGDDFLAVLEALTTSSSPEVATEAAKVLARYRRSEGHENVQKPLSPPAMI